MAAPQPLSLSDQAKDQLRSIMKQPGWRVLELILESKVQHLQYKTGHSLYSDMTELAKDQATIRAYENLGSLVDQHLS